MNTDNHDSTQNDSKLIGFSLPIIFWYVGQQPYMNFLQIGSWLDYILLYARFHVAAAGKIAHISLYFKVSKCMERLCLDKKSIMLKGIMFQI